MRTPRLKETTIVNVAYVYARHGCLLSLIALNSAMSVDTVLRQPINPNCMPVATVSQFFDFSYDGKNSNSHKILNVSGKI